MVVIPPIYFLNMMLLCSTAFMYESDIVIIGAPPINVKGKIAVKAENGRDEIRRSAQTMWGMSGNGGRRKKKCRAKCPAK